MGEAEQSAFSLRLPFVCRGLPGVIAAERGVVGSPGAVGLDLAAVKFDPERFTGFPYLKAEIEFAGAGYLAYFGWLQVVHNRRGGRSCSEIDVLPFLSDSDSPLAAFGYRPTFYDAPANPDQGDGEWAAETFLVAIPDIARSKRLHALAGVQWGYALTGGMPLPLPLEPVPPSSWQDLRPLLHRAYPRWTFDGAQW